VDPPPITTRELGTVTATALTVKVGSYYRTRDGRKAYVAATVNPMSHTEWPVIGWIGECSHSWKLNGRAYLDDSVSTNDLVDEWQEPRTWTETITVFDGGCGSPCQTLGKVTGSIKVLARKTVTLTEGEGL
jgi:hypothetical protein